MKRARGTEKNHDRREKYRSRKNERLVASQWMRQRRKEKGWENQGGGRRGSSNSLTFEQGLKSWSSPESQNRLIPTERETTAGLSLLPAYNTFLNQSTELIVVSKTICLENCLYSLMSCPVYNDRKQKLENWRSFKKEMIENI